MFVGQDAEHLFHADHCQRDDRVAELDRQPGESHPLLPLEAIALVALLEHLVRTAGEDEDRLVLPHQRSHVLARAVHHSPQLQEVPPDRDRVVGMIAQAPHRDLAPSP